MPVIFSCRLLGRQMKLLIRLGGAKWLRETLDSIETNGRRSRQ